MPANARPDHAAAGRGPGVETAAGFKGSLTAATPFELGQFLLLGRKTGALHLVRGAERGVLYFLAGDVVSAVGPNLRGGVDVAMQLLKWTEGEFEFVPQPVAHSDEIDMGTQNLLLETARIMDESGEGEQQVAATIREADELSRMFAAVAAGDAVGPRKSRDRVAWLAEEPGRSLFRVTGHPLAGLLPSGESVAFEGESEGNPSRLLGREIKGPPFNDWLDLEGKRFYLTWGEEGYRIVHLFGHPDAARHLEDAGAIAKLVDSPAPTAIFGPPGTGKSLIAALVALREAGLGRPVLYVSGVPTHDLGDGVRIIHVCAAPGPELATAHEALDRWRLGAAVLDLEASPGVGNLVKRCLLAGIKTTITIRAADARTASESMRILIGEAAGWRFVAPRSAGAGRKLTLSVESPSP